MTSDRAKAYGRVIAMVDSLSLHAEEKDAIRETADALLFTEDLAADIEARETLERLRGRLDELIEAERLTPERAETLLGDLDDCGPLAPVA